MRAVRPRRSRLLLWASLSVLALLLTACGGELPQTTFRPAGPVAREEQELWTLVFPIAVGVFILVQGLILVAVFKFRARGDETAPPKQVHGNTRLEIAWTVVPAMILAGIAVPTVATIFALQQEPADALRVTVVGKQYFWEFQYPDEAGGDPLFTANELHIPTGRPVYLELQSLGIQNDPLGVIHSFWVPRLAGKHDVVPGKTNTMWIQADEPGTYEGQCAEFCGLSHANMRFRVIAEEPAAFDAWLAEQREPAAQPAGLAQQGAEIFTSAQCIACHAINGMEGAVAHVGPDLTHFASRETFAGSVFENTEENLRAWLADPPGVKPGAQMPDLNLTDEQIDALVAFLQSLE